MTTNRFLVSDDPRANQIRRSSSLQLPLSKNGQINPLIQAFSNLKNSTVSVYASTMSVTGFFGGRGSDSAVNLYTLMAKYRCCCGLCRLRVGSFAIAVTCIIASAGVITAMAFKGNQLSPAQQEYLTVPTYLLMSIQLLCSVMFLAGIFTDTHWCLLPFQLSCVLHMMGSMGLGLVLLVSADNVNSQIYPLFAACSMGLVAVYLWFLVICSMTFVMIRDKKRLVESVSFFKPSY
uniref:G_PROTEIN_RECEP_F2_4 domain-containing protein n=1 Tax=Panagrellus redivivus TaxID=6233 RepID=A0A7E4VU44_PANRE